MDAPHFSNRKKEFPMLGQTSARASVVLLFWTYFETRIERLLRMGLTETPTDLVEDTMERYSSIGSRLDRLYRVLFDTTYQADLASLNHQELWMHIRKTQDRRNQFIHGNPQAIDDETVQAVVENLYIEHEAWIQIYNKRLKSILGKKVST